MSKTLLTDAERDTHKVTLGIHLATAARLIEAVPQDWRGALLSLQMGVPHANAIGHAETKSKLFTALNVARSQVKKAAHAAI